MNEEIIFELTQGHGQVQPIRILERKLETDDEWVVDFLENGAFGENVGDLARPGSNVG